MKKDGNNLWEAFEYVIFLFNYKTKQQLQNIYYLFHLIGSDHAGKDNLVDNINLTNPHYRLNIILIIAHTGQKR